MSDRPYVLLSCAMSIDGYIDDTGPERLLLSNDEDFDRVDAERAMCDAILVGAGTIRCDDPRLLIRSERRRRERVARGLPPNPLKVTLTSTGDVDPAGRFFTTGESLKLVYCASPVVAKARERLGGAAEVVDGGAPLDLARVLDDLAERGVRRLMAEGGGTIHTQFLTEGLADELQLVIAPLFVGDPGAPRFVNAGSFNQDRMALAETRQIGDVVLLRYLPISDDDRAWLRLAVDLAGKCPPSDTAFSVGAVVVDANGTEIARAHSRETDPHDHAEEAVLAKIDAADPRLAGATIYSSLEPCSRRASRPRFCTRLILDAGIRRVVFAWREPSVFVDGRGAEQLRAAGVTVIEIPEFADAARRTNAHLLLP